MTEMYDWKHGFQEIRKTMLNIAEMFLYDILPVGKPVNEGISPERNL
jgi:hypothetical protein